MLPPVLIVVGTRPEAIKMAPLVLRLRESPLGARTLLCISGQHTDLAQDALAEFELSADMILAPPSARGDLLGTLTGLTEVLFDAIHQTAPALVAAVGDTSTVYAAALAAAHAGAPFAHVEAGLRTGDLAAPYPEEMYRKMIATLASHHYAPTPAAAQNLASEGVPPEQILVTGNTGVDALHLALEAEGGLPKRAAEPRGLVLVSLHRRETLGEPVAAIFGAIRALAVEHPGTRFLCPVHPNPALVAAAERILVDGAPENLEVVPPLRYREFIALLAKADFLMTDSGGIQEEAPVLGVPVLVLRQSTDRAEAVDAGNALVVGLEPDAILDAARSLLARGDAYRRLTRVTSPFGDGRAASRICDHLVQLLERDDGPALA